MKADIRNKILIGISIVLITILHYSTVSSMAGIHDFYRRLYYIPIIISAFKYRLKGGVMSAVSVVILYAPYLLMSFGNRDVYIINQLLEMIMFIVVGVITGSLVESEMRVKRLLEIQITKLTSLENYTKNILDSILNGVAAIDNNLNITSLNKEGEKILNAGNNYIGSNISNYFGNSEGLKTKLINAMNNNESIKGLETVCARNNEIKIPVRLHLYPLKGMDQESKGMVMIIEDTSQVKKLEDKIRRTEKLSAVGELASGIAHEIRNPLGIIKTIAQTINKDIEEPETKEGLEIIENEIDRANNVIKGLLDFAKPSVFANKPQSIDKLMQNIFVITNKFAEQHNVCINYSCIEDSIISVDGDKLKQAFINIILNSIQAMPSGGKLNICLSSEENYKKISFEDNGTGIESDKLEKIFEPFYTNKDEGTGLGLSITLRIIEEHNGYIDIESEPGKGTKIDVYLSQGGQGGKNDEKYLNS